MKSIKEQIFGITSFQYCHTIDQKEELKNNLVEQYNYFKNKHEHNDKNSWCKVFPFNIIERNSINDGCFKINGSIALKWKVEGRAWYIKRNFKEKKPYKFHSQKKNVPKKKIGKLILKYK